MGQYLEELKTRLAEVADLSDAEAVLSWDQHTYMPASGGACRAEQMATLHKLAHRLLTSSETRLSLDRAEGEVEGLSADSDDRALVEVTRRDVEDAVKLPEGLVTERARHAGLSLEAWSDARSRSEFSIFSPWLRKTIELEQQVAECRGYEHHPYDALLHAYEPGARTTDLKAMFAELREKLVPLVRRITESAAQPEALPVVEYPIEQQAVLAQQFATAIGYDLNRGRVDPTVHPFATSFSQDDVRITVRYHANDPTGAIFAALHEGGHALYEQGMPAAFDRTPLRGAASLGVHESQSRLWENLVGRSRRFWECHYGLVQGTFPGALSDVGLDSFYQAINRVERSYIRVDADEVTYNLHVLVRFEMELDLIDGTLSSDEAPEAWNARMQSHLGVLPPDDRRGILQDVHWSMGAIGYFPTYTIGNLLASQLWETAMETSSAIAEGIENGDWSPLLRWLRETVHRHGRKYLPAELIQRATGKPLSAAPFLRYLEGKYGSQEG